MKKINVDNTYKEDIIKKFTDYIKNTKLTDNTISFTAHIDTDVDNTTIPHPTVYISSTAYLKMLLYIRDTDVEIAWHGTVERNQKQNWYYIKDVFLYPQIIRSTTVDTDQEKYQEWLQNIEDDEVFNNIRFHGHSHVNMGTTPSGTDMNMYHNFLQVLPNNDYYIFMIMNKSGSVTCLIYDLAKNLIYETADVNIKVITPHTQDLIGDVENEKAKYCEKPAYTFGKSYNYEDFYKKRFDEDLYRDTGDVNALLDEIDSKYKNKRLSIIGKKKGGKK